MYIFILCFYTSLLVLNYDDYYYYLLLLLLLKGGPVLATCCLNGSLLDLYIYVNYLILYSYGQINMSVC